MSGDSTLSTLLSGIELIERSRQTLDPAAPPLDNNQRVGSGDRGREPRRQGKLSVRDCFRQV